MFGLLWSKLKGKVLLNRQMMIVSLNFSLIFFPMEICVMPRELNGPSQAKRRSVEP